MSSDMHCIARESSKMCTSVSHFLRAVLLVTSQRVTRAETLLRVLYRRVPEYERLCTPSRVTSIVASLTTIPSPRLAGTILR
jgi:hypothetical protein